MNPEPLPGLPLRSLRHTASSHTTLLCSPTHGLVTHKRSLPPLLQREAHALSRTHSPHLPTLLQRTPRSLTLRHIPGQDLDRILAATARLPPTTLPTLLAHLAHALLALHTHHLVHRDLKPANVILDPTGRAHLIDLALALDLRSARRLTPPNHLQGSLPYLAPEVLAHRRWTPAADLYALAILALRALGAPSPFLRPDLPQTLLAHQRTPHPDPAHLVPDLDPHLASLLHTLLHPDPRRRGTTRDLTHQLPHPTPLPQPPPHATLPPYPVLATLGVGATATVLHAHPDLALKWAHSPTHDLRREARNLAHTHDVPHLVRLRHRALARRRALLVLDLLPGPDLAHDLTGPDPLAALHDAALALAPLHTRGLAHNDVKPTHARRDPHGRFTWCDLAHLAPGPPTPDLLALRATLATLDPHHPLLHQPLPPDVTAFARSL